jgi:hypothetical protein
MIIIYEVILFPCIIFLYLSFNQDRINFTYWYSMLTERVSSLGGPGVAFKITRRIMATDETKLVGHFLSH